jgi:hypothetical protein
MAATGDTVYAVVETEGGGLVRNLWLFRDKDEAIDHIVDTAIGDGYLESSADEEALRKDIVERGYYMDGDVRTTLTSEFLKDDPSQRRD